MSIERINSLDVDTIKSYIKELNLECSDRALEAGSYAIQLKFTNKFASISPLNSEVFEYVSDKMAVNRKVVDRLIKEFRVAFMNHPLVASLLFEVESQKITTSFVLHVCSIYVAKRYS